MKAMLKTAYWAWHFGANKMEKKALVMSKTVNIPSIISLFSTLRVQSLCLEEPGFWEKQFNWP